MLETHQKLRLNILGCGHVGQTLAHLWAKADLVQIQQILNTSLSSAQAAVTFIGAGEALGDMQAMQFADIYMLTCPDKALETCSKILAEAQLIKQGDIVFHCSGALSSDLLSNLKAQGAWVASIHPVKSFANPSLGIHTFQSTYCGVEGDSEAVEVLKSLFEAIGGHFFSIHAEQKTLYHTASVFACNYLVALQQVSLRTFAQAGVEESLALKILQPIVEETVTNVFKLGPVRALTGPIMRGDTVVVERQLTTLGHLQTHDAALYSLLGLEALQLAYARQKANPSDLQDLQAILERGLETFKEH